MYPDNIQASSQCQPEAFVTRMTWSGRKGDWEPYTSSFPPISASGRSSTFTLLSLNIWFEGSPFTAPQQRHAALLTSLALTDADVVNLQEVTHSVLRAFRGDDHFQEKWIISSFSNKVFGEEFHGLVTLVNKHTADMLSCIRVPLDGHPDVALRSTRALLVTEVVKEGTPVRIINSHLVATAGARGIAMRDYQIHVAATMAQKPTSSLSSSQLQRVIFSGDMNLADYSEQDAPEHHGFHDAWRELHGRSGDPGYTFGLNYPQSMETDYPPKRLDRIVYRGSLLPTRFEVMFTEPLALEPSLRELLGHDVHLSDHAGVLAEFSLI